jgi:hypothetical protein
MSINVIDSIAEGINQTNTISPTVWKARAIQPTWNKLR